MYISRTRNRDKKHTGLHHRTCDLRVGFDDDADGRRDHPNRPVMRHKDYTNMCWTHAGLENDDGEFTFRVTLSLGEIGFVIQRIQEMRARGWELPPDLAAMLAAPPPPIDDAPPGSATPLAATAAPIAEAAADNTTTLLPKLPLPAHLRRAG